MHLIYDNFYCLEKQDVENCINLGELNSRKKFLKNSHSLWIRFKNYESNLPIGIVENETIKSIAFVCRLKKQNMINLYDIVSLEKNYGKLLWKNMIKYYYDLGVRNIKFRALYSAIKFYDNLGIYFWGFDGKSFTVEQPLYAIVKEMQEWRNQFILHPVCNNEKLLENKNSSKKIKCTIDDIKSNLGNRYYLNGIDNALSD